MCHSIKTTVEEKLTFEKLIAAHYRACKMKRNCKEVLRFEMDLETNIVNLYRRLKNETYHSGKYRTFTIYEPKQRIIRALPYVDRVVHQWYVEEFIKPFFVPRFINDSYACIEGKGSHKAVEQVQRYMRIMNRKNPNYYVLKCDIKGYFYHIDKEILLGILRRHMRDPKLIKLTETLLDDELGTIGIPIGNFTSQYFANIYLNELDHYLKEQKRVKYYVRYMDDFILLLDTKEEAREMKKIIEEFIQDKLHLELNDKSKCFPHRMGVDFCGYRIYETHILLRKRSKKKINAKIKSWNKAYLKYGNIDFDYINASWTSWLAHGKHSDSYNLSMRMYNKILFKEYLRDPESIRRPEINEFEEVNT